MMEPKRLTEEGSDATSFERELLVFGQNDGLSAAEKNEAWSNILVQLSPLTSLPPAALGPTKVVAKGGLVTVQTVSKAIGVAALVGAVGVGYVALSGPGESAEKTKDSSEALASKANAARQKTFSRDVDRNRQGGALSPSGRVAPGEGEQGPTEVSVAPEQGKDSVPSPAKVSRPIAASKDAAPLDTLEPDTPASRLREESLAVLAARRTLRSGDASGALRLLEAARRDFPRGMLGQEREALTIEALARSGAREVAQKRADTFLSNYPKSPYASDVRAFAEKAQ